jgi:hypothetical protein
MPINLPHLLYFSCRNCHNGGLRSLQYLVLRWRGPHDAVLGILDLDPSRLSDCNCRHNDQSMVQLGGERKSALDCGTRDAGVSYCSPGTCLAELCENRLAEVDGESGEDEDVECGRGEHAKSVRRS